MTRGLVVVALLVAAHPVAGQDSSRAAGPRRSPWITEAAYAFRLTANRDVYSSQFPSLMASLEVGRIQELSPRFAVGAGLSADLVEGIAFSIRPRIKYRVGTSSSLDLAPGLMFAGVSGAPRFTMNASYLWRDRLGVTLESFVLTEQTYFPGSSSYTQRNRLVTYGGIRLGQKLGILGAAADLLAIALAFGAYAIACANYCD